MFSTTWSVLMLRSLQRVKAEPFPGLTNWASVISQLPCFQLIVRPFLMSVVDGILL